MHPIDTGRPAERTSRTSGGIGFCNITKCCTEVCPEHIKITDNAIIPLKERVADELLRPDPVGLAQAPRQILGGRRGDTVADAPGRLGIGRRRRRLEAARDREGRRAACEPLS